MPTHHRITIRAEERRGFYSTSGTVAVTAANPMLAAASALIAHGAEPASTLEGRWEGALVGPATLASITKHRIHPKLDYKTPTYAN